MSRRERTASKLLLPASLLCLFPRAPCGSLAAIVLAVHAALPFALSGGRHEGSPQTFLKVCGLPQVQDEFVVVVALPDCSFVLIGAGRVFI